MELSISNPVKGTFESSFKGTLPTLIVLALRKDSLVLGWEWGNAPIWEFPKIRGTLFWGPYYKDPTI